MNLFYLIAVFTKIVSFGNFAFYESCWINLKTAHYYSDGEWYPFVRGYWESVSKDHALSMGDKNKMRLLGWDDLIQNSPKNSKPVVG